MDLAGNRNARMANQWIWRTAPVEAPSFGAAFRFWGFFYFTSPAGGA